MALFEALKDRSYSVDRFWHRLILSSTQPLPHKLRVAARRRGLARLQRSAIGRADVLFIRHPKTGGTWLRVMLNQLYAQKYGTSERRVFRADELNRQNPDLPRFVVTNGVLSWERLVADAFRSDSPLIRRPKTLFLARHPGDVAVSWYIQYTKRTKRFKRELLEADLTTPVDRESISRWEFLQHPELGLPWLIDYHNFWIDTLAGRDNALVVRYEDLRSQPEATLGEIARFLGESFADEQIANAVAFGSVDNLRALERSNYFRNQSLTLRDPGNEETLKVRRAKVGGYSEDLDAEQLRWVDSLIADRLDRRLGYGPEGKCFAFPVTSEQGETQARRA
jgi:hypothetical protein